MSQSLLESWEREGGMGSSASKSRPSPLRETCGDADRLFFRSSSSLTSPALPEGLSFFSFSVFFRGDRHFLDLAGDSSGPLPASPLPPRLFRFLPLPLPLSLLSLDLSGEEELSEEDDRERLERAWERCLLADALSE